ncbi:MAG: glycosyltransferase family 1 protein [Saprospiraceae bacterium]
MTEPIKTVLIFRHPQPGGHYSIERSFGALLSIWEKHRGAPSFIIHHSSFLSKGLWPRLCILAQMVRLRADVFHITGDIHFAALALPRKKTVLTIHDCGFMHHRNPLARWLLGVFWLKWPVQHCHLVTTVSEATKAEIIRHTGCNPAKIAVVPSAVPDHFRPAAKPFFAEKPRILHIGSAPNKNLRRHIEALRGLPCVLHIVANVRDEDKRLLEQFGIEHEITPCLDDAVIVRAYERCDLLLFASTLEGFGMPVVEAQSVGRPVVTSNCSSLPEVAGREGACFVNPFDTASIREGVLRVVNDAAFRENIVQCGFENTQRFRVEAIAAAYIRLYQKIHAGG